MLCFFKEYRLGRVNGEEASLFFELIVRKRGFTFGGVFAFVVGDDGCW